MTLYQYLSLNETEQYQAVWDIGTHADTLTLENIVCQLYAINDFFVEIHYDRIENKIIGKNQFKEGEHLEKYLKELPGSF